MNKHTKRGMILLLVGTILVCAALGMHLLQKWQDDMAGQSANSLLQQLELNKSFVDTDGDTKNTQQDKPEDSKMPQKEFLGYRLCGSLRIDSVSIHLPILNDWDYDMLKVAPCRYRGTISGENLIIMGHNYQSHFTPLHNISVGETVEFENTYGMVFRYKVAQIEYLKRSEGEKLDSHYPLTLFTCTPGGLERIVVRCDYAE